LSRGFTKLEDLKFLLLKKFHLIEKLSIEEAEKSGFSEKNMVLSSRVATLIANKELSISEIAKILGVSRQAVHATVKEFESKNLFITKNSLINKKIKIVCLTQNGQEIFKKRVEILEKIENKIKNKIGSEKFEILKQVLNEDWL
jgi:DNA-binding MarR family transcriptional regulator